MTDTPQGTVDITNLADSLKSAFVTFNTNLVMTAIAAIPYGIGAILSLPVIRTFVSLAVQFIVSAIANSIEMMGFFLNTAIRKASQAQDFVSAVDAKNKLPPNASEAQYEIAEQAQMAAFSNFVRVSN